MAATVGKGSDARSLKMRWISRLPWLSAAADGEFASIVRSAPATNWSGFALTMIRPRGRASRASAIARPSAAIIGGAGGVAVLGGGGAAKRAVSPVFQRGPAGGGGGAAVAGGGGVGRLAPPPPP